MRKLKIFNKYFLERKNNIEDWLQKNLVETPIIK